jgi:predicted anti-sigma-YlaC factor YlaD
MNHTEHQRAVDLATESGIEGLTAADASWLQAHLSECSQCAAYAESLGWAQQALRSMAVVASPELVAATQARVRIRALELRERNARIAMLALSSLFCVLSSGASVWALLRGVEWLQARYNPATGWVESGVVLSWFLPATLVGVFLIVLRPYLRRRETLPPAAHERS